MKKTIIYVRGHNQEMQEVFCRVYAADKGYKVLFVTNDIAAVQNCDAVLITSHSRISRDRFEYIEIVNDLKGKGIEIECVGEQDNADECFSLALSILR